MKLCGHYSDDGVKRFYGDGLVVRMHSNHRTLEVTGDGCWVVLSKNSGRVHVVGDGCRLHVDRNVGDIEYTGDGGRVFLGPESSKEKVKLVGDGGKVIRDSNPEAESIESSKDRRSEETIYVQHITRKMARKTPRCGKCDNERVRNQEDLENMANEKKEIIFREKCKINEEKRKSSHLSTATRIITKIHSDEPCVRKRMGGSLLVINFHGDSCFVTKNTSGTARERGDSMT